MSTDQSTTSAAELRDQKGGQTITVCLPARNEEATVGHIVETVRTQLVEKVELVDELMVVDDHSSDATAEVAAAAGATVIDAASTLADIAPGPGKGKALWRSVFASSGDLIVWCDADVTNFGTHFVTALVEPLLRDDTVSFVKGYYERPVAQGGFGGGRVTELTARPILTLLYPHLRHIRQPLSGEYAGRRSALEAVEFVAGYGVEIGLLIDLAERFGVDSLAQADLGSREHRNRSLLELSEQATAILQVALARHGTDDVDHALLERPDGISVPIDLEQVPALATIRAT
jgi:glucosyl-3-phosphoglycerate synthase